MKWVKYELFTTTAEAPLIGEILAECGILGYEITDHVPLTEKEEKAMFTDIPADLGEDDGSSILTFYTEAEENEEEGFFSTGSSIRDEEEGESFSGPKLPPEELIKKIQALIRERQEFFPVQMPEIRYEIQDDSMWKDKWKENFKPFYAAEDILIKPSWEEVPVDVKEDTIIIEIDPGSAFGSGTHETTKLCLLSLRKYIKEDTTILDAGCGSGILTIASLLLGAKSAVGLDIDPLAVAATIENAERNGISEDRLRAFQANILEDADSVKKNLFHSEHSEGANAGGKRFQEERSHIVVANILADVIIPLAGQIRPFIAEGGCFISSGILAERADEVEQALLENHFTIIEKNVMGEWCAFVAGNGKIEI